MARGPLLTQEEKDRMRELSAQGLKPGEIAKRLNRSYFTVYKVLKAA
jgi:IS30 family transposase